MARIFKGGKLVIASHNSGKVHEIKELLAPFNADIISAIDVKIGFWPDFGRRLPPPPSMPPHLPTLAHPPTC